MATNAISTRELKVNTEKGANESCAPVTLKQRFEKLLREVFEGHEELRSLLERSEEVLRQAFGDDEETIANSLRGL